MECLEQQQPRTRTETNMRMKIVLKNNQGKNKDARIVNIDETAVQFSDIKRSIVSHFPELEKKEYALGWIDEEHDYVKMESDEEFKIALSAVKGDMLKIHVKLQQNKENVERKCQKVPFPRQYFANLLATRQNISGPGAVVLHTQNIEGIRKVIKKHPGVLFVGGDLEGKIEKMGEKNDEISKKKTQSPKRNAKKKRMQRSCVKLNEAKDSQKLIVKRIIHPQKAIALLRDMKDKNKDEDLKTLSFLFVPIIAGRKRQHCHVFGTWEDSMIICVAFKRRGDGGQEAGTIGGQQRRVERQKIGNKTETTGIMEEKGEKIKKQPNSGTPPNRCMVARKRMKMIASGIFSKIDPTQGSENSVM